MSYKTKKRKKTVCWVFEREEDRGEEGRTGGQTGAERGGGISQDAAVARALALPALPERRGCWLTEFPAHPLCLTQLRREKKKNKV